MKVLQAGLRYFICCTGAISIQAAFVPTSPWINKCNKSHQLFSTKPSSPLSNLQDALPDLDIEKLNPLASSTEKKVPAPPTPPPFDPTNPEALIAITKSFISTDFGIQSSQLQSYSTAQKKTPDDAEDTIVPLPFYSSSSLLSNDFIWVSSNNINDGRAGILNKDEYLAAGRYFNLRKSFPDLEYRAHDFRVVVDEAKMYAERVEDSPIDEITVRFTTLVVGTFRGAPLRLRSKILEPNGKVMMCPPTSVSITYATRGANKGKIIKLVNDMVMDRGFGNTMGLSGIAGAAVVAGEGPSDWEVFPPLVSAGRIFARPMKMIQERDEDEGYLPPFPDSVMIQLAKGVTATNFGLEDPDLLSEDFSYIEPLMGPMDKERYLNVFEEFNVRAAVPDLDYRFQNYRIDPYDPYRVWVDTRARGTRTGPIGKSSMPSSSKYLAPPESISLTFDNDGFCTRMTAAAPLDPLLGNTGLLGGVYGLLYATETPVNPLKTRTFNLMLSRVQKIALKAITKAGVDEYRLSDGRIITGNKPVAQLPTQSSFSASMSSTMPASPKLPLPPKPKTTPFFAAPKANPTLSLSTKAPEKIETEAPSKASTVALTKTTPTKPAPVKAVETKAAPPKAELDADIPSKTKIISDDPQDPVTDAFSSFFGTSDVTGTPSITKAAANVKEVEQVKSTSKIEELRQAAAAARKEAAEAKQRAAEQKALLMERKAVSSPVPKATLSEISTAVSKRSPTLNIFVSSGSGSFSATKAVPDTKASTTASNPGKKSPTLSIFGSAPSVSTGSQLQTTPETQKKSPTLSLLRPTSTSFETESPSPDSPKLSPTFSLFGSAPKATPKSTPQKQVKKLALKGSVKKSQTFSIAGVGGSTPKASRKKSKTKVAPNKSTVKRQSVQKNDMTKSPTFNLFKETPGSKSSSSAQAKKKASKPEATKSSTFSLFGNKQMPVESEKPTTTKSPSFSLFGNGKSGKDKFPKVAPAKTAPKQKVAFSSDKKPSTSSGSLFGGLFGGSGGNQKDESKTETAPSYSKKSSSAKAQTSTAGVPTLKQWKVNPDNSIEARIYGSSSFKDGATVTTSPIPKKYKISQGNMIQTSSGSKYLLS